jgi:hypothetical protein
LEQQERKIAKGKTEEEREGARKKTKELVREGSWMWFEISPYEVRIPPFPSVVMSRVLKGSLHRSAATKSAPGFRHGH